MGDVCLVPAVEMAYAYKLDSTPYPRIMDIYDELMKPTAFKESSCKVQRDKSEQLSGVG
jgi:hypothetical protein